MSKHNRTSRRRRIALGLGATGGGLLAAAFMPVGIALAQPVVPVPDPGNFPTDTETSPDPFTDFTGLSGNADGLLDQQINIDNPILAAQIDYDIDNKLPFSFGTLDGMAAQPATYNPDAGTNDLGPFTDVFANNSGASTGITQADALSYDFALNQALSSTQVGQLDALADGTATTVVTGTPPEPITPDPFLDALNATVAAPTAAELAAANQADFALTLQNATYASQLDKAVEASIANHTLSATSTGGGTADSDAVSDAFTNAGATDALNPGTGFDSRALVRLLTNSTRSLTLWATRRPRRTLTRAPTGSSSSTRTRLPSAPSPGSKFRMTP